MRSGEFRCCHELTGDDLYSKMENQLMHTNEMGLRVGDAYQIEPSDFENNSSDMKDLHARIKTEPLDEFETIGAHGENGLCELMSEQHGLTSDLNEAMDTQRIRMKIEPRDHATFLDHDTFQYLRENGVMVKSEPVSNEEQFDSSDETELHDSTRFQTSVTTSDNLPMPAILLNCDIEKAEHSAENSVGSDSHYPVCSDDLIHYGAVKIEPVEAQSDYTSLTGEGVVEYGETSSQLWRVKNEGEHDTNDTEQSAAPESVPRCQNVGAVPDKTKSVIFLDLDKLERENTSGKAGADLDDAPIFICDDCNQSFGSYTELVQHQTSHFTDARQKSYKVKLNLTIFRCEKCGGNFFDSRSLSQHWDVCNNDECDNVFEGLYQESTCTSSLEDRGEKETAVSGYMYACMICEKKFSSVEALVTHKETYGHHQCRKCYTMFSGMKLIGRHVCNAGRNLIQCCSCACMFERKEAALYSEDLPDPSVPFHNGWCREESIDRDGEGLGQKCNQCWEKVFKCDKCNNAFKSYESLKRHDEKAHPNARTYNCKFCAKAFERKDSLICHEAIHKGINNAKSLQNVVVKNHKVRKRKIDDPGFSPCRARDGKVGRGARGRDKQGIKRATLCFEDIGAHEDRGFSSDEKTGAKQTVSQSSEGVVMNGHVSVHQGIVGVDSKAVGTGIRRQSTSNLETWGDDSKSELNSSKGEYHVSRRTCMAVNVNGEYCTGRYKIDLSDNERRCQKCGSKPH